MPSAISLLPESLDELDRLDRDLLVLSLFEDERPLRGLNGLVDWRANGRLSQMLTSGEITGKNGEKILTTPDHRIDAGRVLIWGLGPNREFDNMAYVRVVERLFATIAKLNASSLVMNIPGSHLSDDYLLEKLAILLKQVREQFDGELTLLIGRHLNFKEMRAKFDLIKAEVFKLSGNRSSNPGKAKP